MSQKSTGKAGVVSAPADANSMDKLASAVLDDLLYNVVHDLLMKTHRDEKQARAATAAIRVETLAAEAAQDLAGATGESKADGGQHETNAASYDNGMVSLKSNPLKTTEDMLCPRCRLPRLLYPTDGRGARTPDPSVTYCKKHPYIDKPGCDIYGQMWVAPGPGRGKKKKDFDKKISAAISAATTGVETPSSSGGGGGGGGPASEQRPPNVLSFPSATCSKCKRCILVSRLNNHMGSCIGNSGRNASRAAAQKISGSMNDNNTPPNSQKGTPMPSSQGTSPRKRDADDFEEADDDSDGDESTTTHRHANGHANGPSTNGSGSNSHNGTGKPKKKFKTANGNAMTPSSSQSSQGLSGALSKKLTLKMKGSPAGVLKRKKLAKTGSAVGSSALSFERKLSSVAGDDDDGYAMDEDDRHSSRPGKNRGSHDYDDDDDDDDDDARSSINFKASAATACATKKQKKMSAMAASASASRVSTPPKKTTKVPIPIPGSINGHKKVKLINKPPLSPPASKNGGGRGLRDVDAESESSGTMSSPRG